MNRGFWLTISVAAFLSGAVATAFAEGGTSVGTKAGTSVGTKAGTSLGDGAAASPTASPGTVRPGCANGTAAGRESPPITGPGSVPDLNLIPSMPYGLGGQSNQYPTTFGYGPGAGC